MFIVIGKIEMKDGNKKKLDACRMFNTDTMEVQNISIGKIREAIRNGTHVLGFRTFYLVQTTIKDVNLKTTVTKDTTPKFRWRKVPRLTGNGELIDIEDAKYMTVIGWHGFAEMKTYHLVNWQGKEVLVNLEEFTRKVKANEINGASYDNKYNRITISRELNKELQHGGK